MPCVIAKTADMAAVTKAIASSRENMAITIFF